MTKQIEPAATLADTWAAWCGDDSAWVKAMRRFGELGGLVRDWGGRPQSHSSIGLTFEMFRPDRTKLPCSYRLKDIKAAILDLESKATP